jgi:hypothetical protein
MKRVTVVRFLILIVSTIALFSCGKENPNGPEHDILISDDVRVLGEAAIGDLHHQEGDSTYYFNITAADVLGLEEGNIIISSQNEGFFRKVRNVSQDDEYIIVNTEFTTLEEAILKGALSTHMALNPQKVVPKYVREGVFIYPKGDLFEVDLDEVVYQDEDTGIEVRLYGSSVFGAELDIDVHWNRGVDYIKFQTTVYHMETLGVEVEQQLLVDESILLAQIPLPTVTTMVGIVPIVLVPQLDIYAGVNVNTYGHVNSFVSRSDTLVGGVKYNDSAWSYFYEYGKHSECESPSVSLSADAEAYCVVPEVSVKVYGVVGPAAHLKGSMRLSANTSSTPLWELYGGFAAEAGIKADIFGQGTAWWTTIYEDEWLIASSGENSPPTAAFTVDPCVGIPETEFIFDASSTIDDQDDLSDLDFRWDWESDGIWDLNWEKGNYYATHSYSEEGIYLATLEVRNSRELIGAATDTVTIREKPEGLILYWRCDKGIGNTVYDHSGNGNDGAIHGSSWVNGVSGNALSFDGEDDWIEADPLYLNEQTINLWINVRGVVHTILDVLIENTDAGRVTDYGVYIYYHDHKLFPRYFLRRDDGEGRYIDLQEDLLDLDTWYMITGTYDGSIAKIFLDGELLYQENLTWRIRADGEYLGLADDGPGGNSPFHGLVDEISIYNRALGSYEIQALYTNP